MTYVDLRPWHVRPVEVLVEGRWRLGELEAYRRDRTGWWGFVRHSEGPGALNHVAWFPEGTIRRVEERDDEPDREDQESQPTPSPSASSR